MLSPLFEAIGNHDRAAVDQLLAGGADPNAISPFHGQSVLYNACVLCDLELARLLLLHGAEPNVLLTIRSVTDSSLDRLVTVLMYVTTADIARLLIEFGADVNLADADGTTALMKAAFFGRDEVVEALLANGADVTARQRNGATALDLAERKLGFWRQRLGKPGMKQDAIHDRIKHHERAVVLLRQHLG